MNGRVPTPAVLDATVLSNFASTDAVWLVTAALPDPVTVPAVAAEIRRGRSEGYAFLEAALDALNDEVPVVDDPTPVPARIASALDAGEAEVLHVARSEDGTLVSDDSDARELADEIGVPVTGSLGVLARGAVNGEIGVETADAWLDTWRTEHGYRSPVDSIADVLPDER